MVYLLSLIVFIPFAFYKDIVAATSGGGNRDVVIEDQHIEMGRYLHRFPHGKVCFARIQLKKRTELTFLPDSLRLTCRVCCLCNALLSLGSATTCLIFAGDTKS